MVAPITPFRGPRYDLIVVQPTAPGPGSALTWTVPNKEIIEIISVRIGLNTSVVVVDRLVYLFGIAGGVNFGPCPATIVQPASQNWLYYFGVGVPVYDNSGDNEYYGPLMSLFQLEAGDSLRITANNMVGNDQIGSCILRYMCWQQG